MVALGVQEPHQVLQTPWSTYVAEGAAPADLPVALAAAELVVLAVQVLREAQGQARQGQAAAVPTRMQRVVSAAMGDQERSQYE